MAGDANEPLIFGIAFLNTVGAYANNDKGHISFIKIDKELFYPTVLTPSARVLVIFEERKTHPGWKRSRNPRPYL